jgi:hypothetical protein
MDFRKVLSAGSAAVVASFLMQPQPSLAQFQMNAATNSGVTTTTGTTTSITNTNGFVNGFTGGFSPFFNNTGVGTSVVVPSGFGYVENFMPADPSVNMHIDQTDYSLHNTTWPPQSYAGSGSRREIRPLVQEWNRSGMRRVIRHSVKHTKRHR